MEGWGSTNPRLGFVKVARHIADLQFQLVGGLEFRCRTGSNARNVEPTTYYLLPTTYLLPTPYHHLLTSCYFTNYYPLATPCYYITRHYTTLHWSMAHCSGLPGQERSPPLAQAPSGGVTLPGPRTRRASPAATKREPGTSAA